MKKWLAFITSFAMILTFGGCGGAKKDTPAKAEKTSQQSEKQGDVKDDSASDTSQASGLEEPKTKMKLKVVGCGMYAGSGEDGTIDAVTGLEKPGYSMVLKEWNKLHPNVEIEMETYPWDNWQASIQTAVLGGDVDVIMHGATLTDLVEPLDDYFEKDPEFAKQLKLRAVRRKENFGPLSETHITGVPYMVTPGAILINKKVFKDYGVDLPNSDWTWDDFMSVAKKLTGKDPKTKKKTYGVQFLQNQSNNEIWKNFACIGYGLGADPTLTYGPTAKETTLKYDDANAMKIWDYIEKLSKQTSPADREGVDPADPVADNDIAMYISEGIVGTYQNLDYSDKLDNYTICNMPRIGAGDSKGKITPYAGDNNMAICNTSKQKDWAWEFIKFCATDKVALQYIVKNGGIPNCIAGFSSLDDILDKDWVKVVEDTINDMPHDYTNASDLYTNNVSFGNLNQTIGTAIRDILMGNKDAKGGAKDVQKMIDEYMKTL